MTFLSYEDATMQMLDYSDSQAFVVDFFKEFLSENKKTILDTLKRYANFDFVTEDRDLMMLQFMKAKDISTSYDTFDHKLSGSIFTPVTALAHYIWGNGETLHVDLEDINLSLFTSEIPALQALANNKANIGTTKVSTKFAYQTYKDSYSTAAYLGSVTLKLDGEFRRTTKDKWSFDGKLKAYHDIYDANPFSDRNAIADLSTKVLDLIGKTGGGTPLKLQLTELLMSILIKVIRFIRSGSSSEFPAKIIALLAYCSFCQHYFHAAMLQLPART